MRSYAKRSLKTMVTFLLALHVAAITTTTMATPVRLDFGGTGGTGLISPAAPAGADFTGVNSEGTVAGVTLNFGTSTTDGGTTVDWSNPVKFIDSAASTEYLLNNYPIMENQVVRDGSGLPSVALEISGLANGTYDLYITAFRGGGPRISDFPTYATSSDTQITDFSALTPKTIINDPTTATTFIEDNNYVVHRIVISASNSNAYILVVAIQGESWYVGVMNSLEIIEVGDAPPQGSLIVIK